MDNYIIIHGSFGSKDGNWFPWLKNELEKDNKDVVVPQMPVGVGNQNFENWSKVLNELKINENEHEMLGDEKEEKQDKSPDKNSPERC